MTLLVPEMPALTPLARKVAAHGLEPLAREPTVPAEDAEPSPEQLRDLLETAIRERLVGLAVRALADGAFTAGPEVADALREAHLQALTGDLVRERALLQVVGTLELAGLDHRVLKGPAVAHLDYPDPAMRSFADIDVLVPSEEWDDAMATLQAAGWARDFGEPRPGFERRFVKSMVLRQRDGEVELDLHRTFSLGPFGLTIGLDDLWRRYEVLRLAGTETRALGREERFLNACFHAALGDSPPRLMALRDVAQIGLSSLIDLRQVLELARSWKAEAVVQRAVKLAWLCLGLDDSADLARQAACLRPAAKELRAIGAYQSEQRSYVGLCLAATRAISRPSDKARYLWAMAFPRRDFVTPRYSGNTSRWRTAFKRLRAGPRSGHGRPSDDRRTESDGHR